jgi:SAM-dependent methyltransferase
MVPSRGFRWLRFGIGDRPFATVAPEVQLEPVMQSALTDRHYWDDVWTFTDGRSGAEAPRIEVDRDPHQAYLDARFGAQLAARGPGARFLEVGAGGSAWPGYLAARHLAEGWGIDFSRAGLAMAARAAERQRAEVHLVEGDLFDSALLPAGSFDVVYSGGFVEHFPDPRPVMMRLGELLAPDGVVITTVPNLAGVNGVVQKWVDFDCYQRHVVFTPASLDAAHALGGLIPVEPARYVGVIDLGAVNFSRLAERLPRPVLAALWAGLTLARRAGERIAARLGARHGGRLLAPSLAGVYRRRPTEH